MAVDFTNLFNIFATPTDVFIGLKERPRWLLAFVCVSLVTIVVAWSMFPFSNQIAYATLSTRLDEQQVQQALSFSRRFEYVGLIFAPIILLVKWGFIAAVLYFLCILLDAPAGFKYRTVFSLLVYSEMILVFMNIVNVLVLYIKGISSIRHVTDLQAIIGMDFLLKNRISNLPLYTFLNSINVFTVWYLATLTIGISVVTGYRKLKSSMIVVGVWLLGVAFQVVMSAISSSSSFFKGM